MRDALLAHRSQREVIIQQAPQQLPPVALQAILKLAVREPGSAAPIHEPHHQLKLLTTTGKPAGRILAALAGAPSVPAPR